jgi:hypothetical protein
MIRRYSTRMADYAQAERDARIAAAMLDEVRAKLVLLKVGSREEDITEARSRRDAAKGRVRKRLRAWATARWMRRSTASS